MKLLLIPAVWLLAFYFFAVRSTPEKRTGWHPDGR